jgi:hypothetical protein
MGFITGLHPDYHTQYDRPEKINYVKMEKIARLVHQVSWDIANGDRITKDTKETKDTKGAKDTKGTKKDAKDAKSTKARKEL